MTERRTVHWPDWRQTKFTPKHLALYKSAEKLILVNAGRAYGKDHILILKALAIMFQLYHARKRDLKWFRTGPIVHLCVAGPTSSNFEDHWRRVKTVLPDIPGVAKNGNPNVHVKESEGAVEIFGDNEILITFKSVFRGDNVRGGGFDILLILEAAYIKEQTITNSMFPLVMRPGYAGYVLMNSTPRGPGHWWDRAIKMARKKRGYWGRFELHEGCYIDNPMTDDEDVENFLAEKRNNIYKYRRERLAWIYIDAPDDEVLDDNEERAFSAELISRALLTVPVEFKPPYHIGMDLAGAGKDKLTVVVIDSQGIICHVEVHSKSDVDYIIDLMIRLNAYWKPRWISYDGNGKLGKEVRGKLNLTKAMPVITERSKAEQVLHFKQHLITGSVRIPHPEYWPLPGKYQRDNFHLLLKETREYRRVELQRQRMRNAKVEADTFVTYSKPPNGTDDVLDAAVYAELPHPVPTRWYGPGEERPKLPVLTDEDVGW